MTLFERRLVGFLWLVKWIFGPLSIAFILGFAFGLLFLVFAKPNELPHYFGFWPIAAAVRAVPGSDRALARWIVVISMGLLCWVCHEIDKEALSQIKDFENIEPRDSANIVRN